MRWLIGAFVIAVLISSAAPLSARQTRAEYIEQARNEFDANRRLELLANAVAPGLGAPDSLWAVAVYDLAQTLIGSGEASAASIWLRWAARHGAQWPIDRTYYSPAMIQAYESAVEAVERGVGPGDAAAATSWRWPRRFDRGASSLVEVRPADASVRLSVNVADVGDVAAGAPVAIRPGSYEVRVSADGFEPARITREFLPGITTVLEFDLPPLLPAAVRASVAPSVVMIRYADRGEQVCVNGTIAGADGLVLASRSALGRTRDLEVVTSERTFIDVSVAHAEAGLDVAVLRLDAARQPVLPRASGLSDGDYAWAVYRSGCGELISTRTRLLGWRADGPVTLSPSLPLDARGGPLVDRSGALIGLVRGPDVGAPIALTDNALARARGQVVTRRGGPPWVWIGAGAAAVGVAAVVLGGGGNGGVGNGGGPPVTTGGIIITFPGGSP